MSGWAEWNPRKHCRGRFIGDDELENYPCWCTHCRTAFADVDDLDEDDFYDENHCPNRNCSCRDDITYNPEFE